MDWTLFWSGVTAIIGFIGLVGAAMGYVFNSSLQSINEKVERGSSYSESYTDAKIAESIAEHQREIIEAVKTHVDLAIEAKLATLAADITTRINGTYLRTSEANARFADIQRQLDRK